MKPSLTVVDLFAGAGGLGYAMGARGFNVLYAADSWAAAVETYSHNLGHRAVLTTIDESTPLPVADVIVGGPPCQGFSSAGARRADDPRNSLISVFARIIARQLPRAFVFENVEGFLTSDGGNRVFDLLTPLIAAGYRIHLRKVNAANYGVPQHRKRVVAIGGLGWDPHFPKQTHRAFGAPGAWRQGAPTLPDTPTVLAALEGLPEASQTRPGKPEDHYFKAFDDDDLVRAKALKPGMTMKDLPESLWHPSYRRRAFRRVMDGTATERRGGAPAGVRRLNGDEPSKAITSGARTEFIHPVEHRTLTLRECARLQTFPDDFAFKGSQADRALLIGNAIPPLLGSAIAESVFGDLSRPTAETHPHGELLSFVPTVSEGTSPVLARLIERIEVEFGSGSQLSLVR